MIEKIRSALRAHPVLAGTFAAVSATANVLSWVQRASDLPSGVSATAIIVLGWTYLLRWLTHLRFYLFKGSTRRVRLLVFVELLVGLGWEAGGAYVLWVGSSALLLALCLILAVVVGLLAAEVADAVEIAGIDTASEQLERTRLVQWLELALVRLHLEALLEIFGSGQQAGRASRFMMVMLTLLVLGIAVNVSAGTTEASERVTRFVARLTHRSEVVDAANGKPKPKPKPPSSHHGGHDSGRGPNIQQPFVGRSAPVKLTYEDLCGPEPTGLPAPEPQASNLASAFLAAGQPASGCAGVPTPVVTATGAWTMPGYCGGELYSLAVASAGGHAVLLIGGDAAGVGARMAAAHALLDVSDRVELRGGDAYAMATVSGNAVIVRSWSGPTDPNATSCGVATGGGSRYVLLSPQLASLWLTLAKTTFTWPQVVEHHGGVTRYAFYTDQHPSAIAATARCDRSGCAMERVDHSAVFANVAVTGAVLRTLR
jgi:hypothetical protein